MTQSTEQERAEFEAAFIAEKIRIAGAQFTEEMARAFFLQMKDGEYVGLADQQAWWAWQASAARRAQVVPVDEIIRDVMHLIDDWSEKDLIAAEASFDPDTTFQEIKNLGGDAYAARLAIDRKLRASLAAAPQPAAAVDLLQ